MFAGAKTEHILKIFHNKTQLVKTLETLKEKGLVIGFVPTMGALHQGHLSLVEAAEGKTDIVVVSIFVNPTQFDNVLDLKNYPRTIEADVDKLKSLNFNNIILYVPEVDDVYTGEPSTDNFQFGGLESVMEGAYRVGHFNGVATIVKWFFDIIKPDYAFFGQKDYQQLLIVKKLVKEFQLDITIVGCPIHRELDGLAMSSRNARLAPDKRKAATFIYKMMNAAKTMFGTESANVVMNWVEDQFEGNQHLDLEYFQIADAETLKPVKRKSTKRKYRAFIAAYAGDVRLIDNIALN